MKILHVTDTHLVPPGQLLYGLDPLERLRRCIDDIVAHHADARLLVITGDLAHRGEEAAYRALRTQLERLPMPWHALVGNHDARGPFAAVFPDAPRDESGFVQSARRLPEGDFLFLDTLEEGIHGGRYCDRRAAWLARRLDEAGDRPVFLFMHHPPFPVGIPCLDAISLQEPAGFAALVAGRRNIRHLFYGHVHRPVCGSWLGIPVSTMRALNHQVPFDLVTTDHVPQSHEPPAYGVAFIEDDRVTVHFHDYLDRRTLVRQGNGYAYAP